jgi:hypothetical protein
MKNKTITYVIKNKQLERFGPTYCYMSDVVLVDTTCSSAYGIGDNGQSFKEFARKQVDDAQRSFDDARKRLLAWKIFESEID